VKLLTYETPDGLALGLLTPTGVLDVAAAAATLRPAEPGPWTPGAFTGAGTEALPRLAALATAAAGRPDLCRPLADVTLGPCVVGAQKLLCIGVNYRSHAGETGAQVPAVPIVFSKFANALSGHGRPVALPAAAEQYDYEVELAVVMGRRARVVPEAEALSYVLGYCCANDLSARDLQFRTSQWLLGKTSDGFLPLGPYLVTADEVPDPQALRLRCWVDGELRQDAGTAEMVFPVAALISYLSRYMTLEPGDVICTGTPEGVILGHKEKAWLRPGNEVTVEVEGLGRLTTPLIAGL